MRLAALATLAVLAACPAPRSSLRHHPHRHGKPTTAQGQLAPTQPNEPTITWKRVESPADVPHTPPAPGTFRVHLIDVGTGLAMLIQGPTWNVLYDAGTNDPGEKPMRVVAYLSTVLGPSGDDLCVPSHDRPGSKVRLDHVFLSHPHFDHASALDLVVHCFDVQNVWDSGRVNDAAFYRAFLESVGRSRTTVYHTAADVPSDHMTAVKGEEIHIDKWERFSEGDTIALGGDAKLTILHADAKKKPDPNQNSVVVALQLGTARMLLVGDSESGPREDPNEALGDVEEFLVDHHRNDLPADILQVGHHGSKTSSRAGFIEVVHPKLALVSAGPKKYGSVTLPDIEIVEELEHDGIKILRTDEHDESCDLPHRIGGDSGPGGCDSYVITIDTANAGAAQR